MFWKVIVVCADLYRDNLSQLFSVKDTQFLSEDSLDPLLSGKVWIDFGQHLPFIVSPLAKKG